MKREPGHLDFLDYIRGVAILSVFVFHCLSAAYHTDRVPWNGWLPDFLARDSFRFLFPATFGWAGVAMFFVISGFCIHLSHRRSSRPDMGTFFTRRFFRIYPPYFVALSFFIFCDYQRQHGHRDSMAQMGSHLLLFNNLKSGWFYGINPSFWSIAVEVQLYLLYPALIWLVDRWGWTIAVWITAVVEIALRGADSICSMNNGSLPFVLNGLPFHFWLSWSIGALAAEAFLNRQALPLHQVPVWLFPVALVLAACFKPLQPFCFLLAALSTVCWINLLLSTGDQGGPRGVGATLPFRRHLSFAGIVSYSFYLLHQQIVLSFAIFIRSHSHFNLSPLAIFAACLLAWMPILLLSWCFYRLFEMPSIALGKILIRKWGGQRTAG